jgi:1-acyl-sn-glycerol-3-phosphate acyltransferase
MENEAEPTSTTPARNHRARFGSASGHRPTDTHRRFVAAGRWSTRFAAPVARFDFPDHLTLPTSRPVLFAGNHRSLLDLFATLAIFARFDASSRLLIRADYVDRGPAGVFLRSIGSIAMSSEKRQAAEDEAVASLQAGELVSIMPEGKLVRPADWQATGVGPGRTGVSRIARRAGAAVVPVAFTGTEQVWPRGGWPKVQRPRPTVRIRTGTPLDLTGDDDQANADLVMEHLGALVRANTR